jgi:hypothetical protein
MKQKMGVPFPLVCSGSENHGLPSQWFSARNQSQWVPAPAETSRNKRALSKTIYVILVISMVKKQKYLVRANVLPHNIFLGMYVHMHASAH